MSKFPETPSEDLEPSSQEMNDAKSLTIAPEHQDNDNAKIRSDAEEIASMIRNERDFFGAKTLDGAQRFVAERMEHLKKDELNPEEMDYIRGIVKHSYAAMKYTNTAQFALNFGKIIVIGAIASVPSTFVISKITYGGKEEALVAKQTELETRLSHGKQETPIIGTDHQGDMIITYGNTTQMLAQTKMELTTLQEQGATISNVEILGGLACGAAIMQIAGMFVRKAWQNTAQKIGEKCAELKSPLPQKHVAIPNFEAHKL